MAYTRTNWIARVGTALNRFLKTNETPTEVELTNDPTGVTIAGTPFTVDNMNKIEQGIYDAHVTADNHIANTSNPHAVTKEQVTGLKTTDSPTFATINTGGLGAFLIGQNLRTTDNVSFANINPPVDNNDASMPSVGIGGFSYATALVSTNGAYPSITIGSGGTWVCVAASTRGLDTSVQVNRIAGGSSVQGLLNAQTGSGASVYVIAWRIA